MPRRASTGSLWPSGPGHDGVVYNRLSIKIGARITSTREIVGGADARRPAALTLEAPTGRLSTIYAFLQAHDSRTVSMVVASLSLRHLARHYGQVRAVDDLSLEVPDGAFVTLLGPSGCGKSTTLNLVAGLDRAERRHDPPRRPGRHQGAAQRAPDGDGLPELRALPEHDRLREHRLLAEAPAPTRGGDHRAGHGRGRDARHRPPAPSQAGRAVRRAAAARGARSRPRQAAPRLPARRAVQQPRRRASGADAHRGQAPPPRAGHDQRVRDPRPGRGDDPIGPHLRHARRQDRPVRIAARDLRASRETCTWPNSSASRG